MPKIGPALTWDELADLYPGTARIRPMQDVFNWVAAQTKRFHVHPKDETIHLIIKENPKDDKN